LPKSETIVLGSADKASSPPLGMVMEACPDLHDYAPLGKVRDWSDLRHAALAVRPMLGISPDAWQQALEVLGERGACLAVAAILQRCEHSSEARVQPGRKPGTTVTLVNGSPAIRSAGGYLRALTQKAREGDFSLGPVLMAQIGQRQKQRRLTGSAT
jgi:replication initiation protein RepC